MTNRFSVLGCIFSLFLFSDCTNPVEAEKDTQAPTVSILYPVNGSEITLDTTIWIKADANDNNRISMVDFYIDGNKVGSDNAYPYEYSWKTTGKAGDHSIMAKAIDSTGNVGTSLVISVKVIDKNLPPDVPTNPYPAHAATDVWTTETLRWTCTDPNGNGLTFDVYFDTNNPPTTRVSAGQSSFSYTCTGLMNFKTYYWRINAKDNKGAATIGSIWSFITGSGVIVPVMAAVDSGTFIAGTTSVMISPLKMDKYEITYEQWTEVRNWALLHGYTDADIAAGRNGYIGSVNHPVTEVNWFDVVKWCNARSEKDGLTPVYYTDSTQSNTVYRSGEININVSSVRWLANGYRLPTEAEWQYASRGGSLSHGHVFSGSDEIDSVAWYSVNSGTNTHPIAKKQANEIGIFDMSGNVSEWCWDWYGNTYPAGGLINPKGPSTIQTNRVIRGGQFSLTGGYCRIDNRLNTNAPRDRNLGVGFRCVKN